MTGNHSTKIQRRYKSSGTPPSGQHQRQGRWSQCFAWAEINVRSIRVSISIALSLVIVGCVNQTTRHPARPAPIPTDDALNAYVEESAQLSVLDIYTPHPSAPPANVMQTGRYQLVPLQLDAGQRNLLKQLITVDLSPSVDLTVQRGIEHALMNTGLSLCQRNSRADSFAAPLPVVHKTIGPTTLGRALQVLAGPAWRLHVNFTRRTVCFTQRRPFPGDPGISE